MRLNFEDCKEYRFGDLISSIYKAKALNKDDLIVASDEKYSIRYITRTAENNGCELLADIREIESIYIEEGNAISIGDTTATCFYQDSPFITGDHMVVVRADSWLNEYTALFIVTLLNNEQYKYSYGRAYLVDRIKDTILKLPEGINGEPDWKGIEDYIKTFHYKALTTKNKINNEIFLDISKWKEFRIGDFFRVYTGGDMWLDEEQSGQIPVICLGGENNGVCGYIDENPEHPLYPANSISVAGWAGGLFAFYQEKDFYVKGRVKILVPKNFNNNKYISLFLCTLLNQEEYRYSYGRKASADHIPNTILKLPAILNSQTNKYEPDWEFMENYIRSLPYGDRI